MEYAGFLRRLYALIIDGLILFVFFLLVQFLASIISSDVNTFIYASLFAMFVSMFYFILMPASSMQGTLGKKALGIKIVDLDGHRIGFFRSFGRFLISYLSALILFLGYFMAIFTERKQTLHDIVMGTLVVVDSLTFEANA